MILGAEPKNQVIWTIRLKVLNQRRPNRYVLRLIQWQNLKRKIVAVTFFLTTFIFGDKSRPHSVSFLGKETDTATPLRLENFGRIDFSLGRWITRGKKTPKSMTPYAKVPGELVRIFFHSLL